MSVSLFGRNGIGFPFEGGLERMPREGRTLDADGELAHAGEDLQLVEALGAPLAGHHVVESGEERLDLRLRPALDRLAHERRGRGRDGAAGAGPAEVFEAVALCPDRDGDLVAAEGVVARGGTGGLFETARVPRLLVVVEDDLLVQVSEFVHERNTSATFFNPAARASISSFVL